MAYKNTKELSREARRVHRLFTKPELKTIAEELEIDSEGRNTRQLVLEIVNDLVETGLPDSDECSDELFEFMLNINFIDEDGRELDISIPPELVEEEKELAQEDVTDFPECFSFADIRDPACKRCTLFEGCSVARKKARPKCFGLRFSARSEECRVCIEANACRTNMK